MESVMAGTTPDHKPSSSPRNAMSYIVVAGRLLYSAIFITAGFQQIFQAQETIGAAAKQGVPLAHIAVPGAAVIAIFGGVSIVLGYYARVGAWLLVLFLVPVTLMLHNFWGVKNPTLAQTEQIMFMKNLSMLGGALLIAYFGSGPLSLDARGKNM
jgi:putative oxidoreductase